MAELFYRPIALDDHPLRKRAYRVPTPSIAQFKALIEECLFLYIPGALIYGHSRIGKTYAIEFLRLDLERRYKGISILKMRCHRTQIPSENTFFGSLLSAAGHPVQAGESKAALRGRLVHKIRQVADRRGDNRIILFADEAQNLREIEYEWLRDLHDDLENSELRLFTFLVGQRQLLAQKSAFQAQDREHIVARFMIEELEFHGIVSAAECQSVLAGYDSGEYPANSGWSFTRFCMPKAFDAGLRLKDSSTMLWGAFEAAHLQANLDGPLEIPMKFLTAAVEAALLLSVQRDMPELTLEQDFWDQMVARSRYVLAKQAVKPKLTPITSR